jgi:ATP-dependent protease HslVU (ClpYQ) peptidase subunit
MSSVYELAPDLSATLRGVTQELRQLEDLLVMADKPDPNVLTEFRDVVNRLRQTAWAVQQYGSYASSLKLT